MHQRQFFLDASLFLANIKKNEDRPDDGGSKDL
jgi:hypothetical protein